MKKFKKLAEDEGWIEEQRLKRDHDITADVSKKEFAKRLEKVKTNKNTKSLTTPSNKNPKLHTTPLRHKRPSGIDKDDKEGPSKKKLKASTPPLGAKVDSKAEPTGVQGEELLDDDPEPKDPFLTHLDQCDADFRGGTTADVTQPLPVHNLMQLDLPTTTRNDGGGELDYTPKIIFDDETNGNICIVIFSILSSVISSDREGTGQGSLRVRLLNLFTCFIAGRSTINLSFTTMLGPTNTAFTSTFHISRYSQRPQQRTRTMIPHWSPNANGHYLYTI